MYFENWYFSLEQELQQRAFNLSLAALLGNEVYNFGELVSDNLKLKFLLKLILREVS